MGDPKTVPPHINCVWLCSDTMMKFKKNYSSLKTATLKYYNPRQPPSPFYLIRMSGTPPPPPSKKKFWIRRCTGTPSLHYVLYEQTKPLLINRTAQSFPVYLLLVPHNFRAILPYCQTNSPAPPPPFAELGASPSGQRNIWDTGIASTTDRVGKPQLFIKQTNTISNQSRSFRLQEHIALLRR